MTKHTISSNKIALLATGDEISNGDILNSNAQEIAQRLFNNGMSIGMQMVTPDNLNEIETAIRFLLEEHRALIITGGLGPTSDDITRFAFSNALHSPLVFNETIWETIVARLKHFGYDTPPETNRQQALFPKEATVIPNPNGTAAGCLLKQKEQFIFMLPGPPVECLPMVESVVLPTLKDANFQQIFYHQKWLLFGVSEGQIAEELDAVAKPFQCKTGYRLAYPYIEFKLYSNHEKDFTTLVPLIEKIVAPYLICDGRHTASELLKKQLSSSPLLLTVCDTA